MDKLNDTTRCYPRTLLEAFPQDVKHWEFIEYPDRRMSVVGVLMWIVFVGIGLFFFWHWTVK